MNTDTLSSVYNRLPGFAQRWIKTTDTYDRLLAARREEHYSEQFTSVTITVLDSEFEVVVPEWGGETYWLEHDPYNPKICHEPPVSRRFVENVETGDVVWDMGSRYGYYASIAAQLNDTPKHVHVFEMSDRKSWLIEQMSEKQFGGDINVINKRVDSRPLEGAVSGDAYAEKTGYPDVVKIDIEGAEAPALHGMRTVIREAKPTLLIETHPNKLQRNFGSNDDSVLQVLHDHGYDIEVCERFRNYTGEWDEDWEQHTKNLHQLTATARSSEDGKRIGQIDPDSYAVFAEA